MLRPLAVLTLLLTLALAACGDDDGGAPSQTPSAAPSASPTASPAPSPDIFSEQLSYFSPDGEIRLVNPDGSGEQMFAVAACEVSTKESPASASWSPDGTWLAYLCLSQSGSDHTLVTHGQGGAVVDRVEGVSYFRWSPDGSRIAYQQSAEPEVRLLSPGGGVDRTVRQNAILLEWVGPGSLLLGLEPTFGDYATAFMTSLIRLESGESTALPRLDNLNTVWGSPDGARVIVLTNAFNPSGSGLGMAVYGVAGGQEKVIDGGYIGYPSDFVPHEQLAFSSDGSTIYWANAADGSTSVWTAGLDAPRAQKLGEVQSIFVAVSPGGRVAGVVQTGDPPGRIVMTDPKAGTRAEVGPAGNAFAWRTLAP